MHDTPEASSSRFILRLFGSFECRVDGRLVTGFRSKRSQSLLALLALRPNSAVSRKWLADLLWPDSQEERSQFYLRRELSALRQALGRQAWRIESPTRDTLRFNPVDSEVDVTEFDDLSNSSDRAALEHALVLYRGPLLAGVDEEWLLAERTEREQSEIRILSQLTDALTTAGNYAEALPVLRRAIAIEPLRESLHRSLFLALAALGDYAAIAVSFRKLKSILRREIAAEPSPETLQCLKEIREQAHGTKAARDKPSLLPAIRSGNLPRLAVDLLGRDEDVGAVTDLLANNALVALTGPGGIGKTSLAIRIGELLAPSMPVRFVRLGGVFDAPSVSQAVCHALGTPTLTKQNAITTLCEFIADQHLLIIVDNCEQVHLPCSEMFESMRQHCPNLRILATSRHSFSIPGARNVLVAPLRHASAEELRQLAPEGFESLRSFPASQCFLNRAERAGCAIDWNPKTAALVASICQRVDGVPLAIELAAARTTSLSLSQIESKLSRWQSVLTQGGDQTNPRQRTLAAAIDWSVQLLSSAEAKLFASLAVFAGGWSLEAAESICWCDELPSDQIAEFLTALVDKSLVSFDPSRFEGRYRFLEPIRAYALELFNAMEGKSELRRRHFEFYFTFAEDCAPYLVERESIDIIQMLEADIGNLKLCEDYCRHGVATDIVIRHISLGHAGLYLVRWLLRLYFVRGYLEEGLAFAQFAIQQADAETPPGLLAWGYLAAAIYQNFLGNPSEAYELLKRSRELGQSVNDLEVLGRAEQNMGWVHYRLGQLQQARICYLEALSMHRESGVHAWQALNLNYLAEVELSAGNYWAAEEHVKEAREISQARGCLLIRGYVQMTSGIVALACGRIDQTETFLNDAIETLGAFGTRFHLAMAYLWQGRLAAITSRYDIAEDLLGKALRGFQQISSELEIIRCLETYAWIALQRGDSTLSATVCDSTSVYRRQFHVPVTKLEAQLFGDLARPLNEVASDQDGGKIELAAVIELVLCRKS